MIVIEAAFAGVQYPLDHPRIGAFPVAGMYTATSSAAGFDAAFAGNGKTTQWWQAAAMPATWTNTFTAAGQVSYVGIAAHSLGSSGATVVLETLVGAVWMGRATHTPVDNTPILFLITRVICDGIRIVLSGSNAPLVGVVFAGDITEFPQKSAYVGRSDYRDLEVVEYATPKSEGGNFLGRYETRRGQAVALEVMHISEDWKAAYLDGLLAHLHQNPAFVADRAGRALGSVLFGYTASQPQVTRGIAKRNISVEVKMEWAGHVA
jgi:hypothetical protein